MFVLITICLAFLISILSATALMGLLMGFKFLIFTIELSLIILPFHLLGLNALIGETESFFELRLNIGPLTDKLYAVLPAGVETKIPSEINFLIKYFFPEVT